MTIPTPNPGLGRLTVAPGLLVYLNGQEARRFFGPPDLPESSLLNARIP
jgi:hypothetical protein